MASNAARIAEIKAILRSGVIEDEVDNQRVRYDHDSLRKELKSLEAQENPARRPVVAGIKTGGFQ